MGDDDDDQPLPGEHDSRRARLLLPQRGAAALDPPLIILHREHAERNFNWCAAGITWIDTANCIIIAPKRLKLRLSGSARKSQKRFRDTPM
eukprot:COSAG06_NODE_41301_length_392_cov_14.955631_1_plen_90_part_10